MHPLLHSARRLAACLTLLTGSFSLLPAQNFVTHDANNTEATFDFSQFDPAVNAPGLRTYLGLRIKVGYYVFAGDQSINVETTPDNGADKPYREVAFHENVSRGTKDVVGLGPDGPLALYENATTWKFTGTSPILVGGSFELGLARPEIVFDHFIIQPHSTYSMFFSFLTIGTSDLKLKLVGHNLLQNNDISFQNDFSTTSIGIENCSKWKTIDPPTSLTLSLSGDSLTIFYPPNTIPGETLIPNRFEGSDDGEYSLIIDNKYLDVQGGLINWKTITLNDGVVTATKRSAYNLGSLMPEGTSGVCSRWYEGGNLIINGGSLKADVFKKTACPDFCDRLMENIQPVNSDNQPVFRVLVPHHGLFNFSVTGTGGTSFNQTYSFSAHHPDDDPNYYIYLPSGSYSISFEGHEPQSVTVNNAHQPIEGGDETVTPPSDEANYVHSYPPSEETISINIRQEKALRVSVKEEQCDLGITPTSTKPIPLPEPRDDYQILFSDHLNPQLTGPGSTTFTIGNNIHHMVFNNTYFEYFNINRFNTLDALRHLDFQGDNTVWRQPGNPGEEGGIQFALNFAAVSKTAGIVISGDSLTVGGLYQPYGALTSGSRGAFHLELDIDYLTLWGGLGGVSVVNLYNGIDSVFVKKGVVTSLGEEAGMYCTNKVFIEPSASLKSQSFDSTACGSLSFFGDGRSGYIDVRPTNLAGKPVYCVAIPNEGGKSVYMQDLNSSFRLQVYFTSHHPLYDHQTGQPIPGTADPYYYIFLPNSEYRFSIQNLHKFEASVEGEDVIATPFSLNFDDYS
ncbi:MAG: hypothetical protein LBU08_00065, partial [Tannerellaceae bacterium]|nr:hypothetical protein [Tannerellaceae bacterium]